MAFRWIHLSDFHFTTGDPYAPNTVLTPLLTEISRRREKEGFQADALFVTGDIADKGKAEEYQNATDFFNKLLTAAALDKSCLYIAPGNHDVDMDVCDGLLRSLQSETASVKYFAPDKRKYHYNKFKAFEEWYDTYFKGVRNCPKDNTCYPVQTFMKEGKNIAVLAINTALFSYPDDKDHNALWIGRRNLDAAVQQPAWLSANLRFVLLHHPLDWLHDQESSQIKATLQADADFILRGHLHKNEVDLVVNNHGSAFQLAAGACYQTREFPNTALFGTLHFDDGQLEILPIEYKDAPKSKWALDTGLFDAPDYIGRFSLPKFKKRNGNSDQKIDAEFGIQKQQAIDNAESIFNINDIDAKLLKMVVNILAKNEAASRSLAAALAVEKYAHTATCLEKLAKTAVTTPLETLFNCALECQMTLRKENPPQTAAADLIARFMEAVFPAQDSAKAKQNTNPTETNSQLDPFQLMASHPTLAEISLARRDERPAQFRFDAKRMPKGKGQLDHGEGWETGRDQDFLQFEKDVIKFILDQFETEFGQDWRYSKNGESIHASFEQKGANFEKPSQEFIELFKKFLQTKAKQYARNIRKNGHECESFTFYFLIKASPWLTQAEKAKQDIVLHKLTNLFPGIAFLRLTPATNNTGLESTPFLDLYELLNPNQDER